MAEIAGYYGNHNPDKVGDVVRIEIYARPGKYVARQKNADEKSLQQSKNVDHDIPERFFEHPFGISTIKNEKF